MAHHSKQRELVEETPRELPWIESGSFVRDFWSAVEYGGIPDFLGRLKANGKMGSRNLAGEKMENKKISIPSHYQLGCNGSGNGP